MKQYTNSVQTAKLIKLGFEQPKNERWVLDVANESTPSIQNIVKLQDYSIAELIEILPMEDRVGERSLVYDGLEWVVNWDNGDGTINQVVATELIDALYNMIIRLKEEGVI